MSNKSNKISNVFAKIRKENTDKISEAIKSILRSHGVNEVVLASPLGPEYFLSDYDEEIAPDILADDVEIWWEPEWIDEYGFMLLNIAKDSRDSDDDFPRMGHRDVTLLVRLGIVNGAVMYTKQPKWFDEVTYDSSEEPETDWLPIDTISDVEFWEGIVYALTKIDDIWVYTSQYPNLHRLK